MAAAAPLRTLGYLAGRRLRHRAAATAGLVLLVALTAGSVAALVAGARRTTEVWPEMVASTRATGDVAVFAQLDDAVPFEADEQEPLLRLLEDLPEVGRVGRGTLAIVEGGGGRRLLGSVALDPGTDLTFGRPVVVDGTWPAPDDPTGIAIDEELAAREGLGVGDRYRVAPYTIEQFGPAGEGADVEAAGRADELEVRAVYRYPMDLLPTELDQEGLYVDRSGLHLTSAWWASHGGDVARYGVGAIVQLAAGATADDLSAALDERIPGRFTLEFGSILGPTDPLTGIERAIDLQAGATLAVAGVTGVTGAALVLLLLGRRADAGRASDEVLHGLGLGRADRRRLALLEGAGIGLAGAALGAVGAVVGTRWLPFGLAARADLSPGIELDVPVLAATAAATVALVVAATAIGSVRGDRRQPAPTSASAARAVALGAGPAAATGLRFALQPDRRARGVPGRAAIAGVAATITVLVGVLLVAASFDRVRDEPGRYGAYGDAVVGNVASLDAAEQAVAALDRNPDVAAYVGETVNELELDGDRVWVSTVFPGRGDLRPRVVAGRVPQAEDEIALGREVLDDLGLGVGDVVRTRFAQERPVAMRIVGQSLVHDVDGTNGGPGKSGIIAAAAMGRLDPEGRDGTGPTWFVVDLADDAPAGALARLADDFPSTTLTPRLPSDLVNVERMGGLLVLLAVLVAALGAGAAALATLGAVRHHRRDLAVLRALGFVRRQAGATVAWQASTYLAVGLLVGLPAGFAAGTRGWAAIARNAGVADGAVVPTAGLLVVVAATVLAVHLVAAVPGARARRLRAADVLRAE